MFFKINGQHLKVFHDTPLLEEEIGTAWKDKLHGALWAYRIAYKTPLGMSPYQLVYKKTCHLLVKLEFKAHWAIKRWNRDFKTAGKKRKMQLSELEE